jgi:hypothetical protein
MKSDQLQYRREPDLLALALPQQLRQPRDVDGDPPRLGALAVRQALMAPSAGDLP